MGGEVLPANATNEQVHAYFTRLYLADGAEVVCPGFAVDRCFCVPCRDQVHASPRADFRIFHEKLATEPEDVRDMALGLLLGGWKQSEVELVTAAKALVAGP